jgi:hypothetical protein
MNPVGILRMVIGGIPDDGVIGLPRAHASNVVTYNLLMGKISASLELS